MQDVVYGQHAWVYVIMWTKLALVSLFCKSQRFKQQISKFYPHVISTEASYHIYTSHWLVINVWPIFIKFGTVTQIGPLQGTDHQNFEFLKIGDGGGCHLENHKIAISQQRIDWSSWNFSRLCKMGLLTIHTVKNLNFQNPGWLLHLWQATDWYKCSSWPLC